MRRSRVNHAEKGKGKGGGKGKKGKKGKKAKAKEEAAIKDGIHNSNLWEAQLHITELARKHYRDIAGNLAYENEGFRDRMRDTEQDTIEVVTYLRKQDAEKDAEVDRLQQEVQFLKMEHRKNKDELVAHFTKQKRKLDEKISRKESELETARQELNDAQSLRKRKSQMQKELEDIKDATFLSEREHKETLQRIEQKFFEERIHLQQESKEKIDEIAARAQEEALKSLAETSRKVYRENGQLIESIRAYKQEFDQLQKTKDQLRRLISRVSGDQELNEILIKEKVEQIQKQNNTIKELKEKIQLLESSLTQFIDEFAVERKTLVERSRVLHETSRTEIVKLQRTLESKTKEMCQVKKLAKVIIEQRSELESFFLDAMQHVKKQIAFNRTQYRRDAFNAYQNRMLNAHHGQGDYPKIRTFNETFPGYSTNSVFHDLEEATRWTNLGHEVDFGDLTWEQKEQVLRALFLRMNTRKSTAAELSMQNTQVEIDEYPMNSDRDDANNVFVTQTAHSTPNKSLSVSRSSTQSNNVPKLPQITAGNAT